ncbi:hypothetical protein LUQ84_000987 [Hamiltosporidium tvaerminnensis]|nr:hypothetical protein LUQ84_000987 [Hamiltosporidium tvaerminnensis]
MSKKDSRGEIVNEIDISDDEFFMDSFGDKEECDKNSFTNFVDDNENEENDNDFSSDIIVNKRSRTIPLPSTSSSEEDVSETRDNRPWKDFQSKIIHQRGLILFLVLEMKGHKSLLTALNL